MSFDRSSLAARRSCVSDGNSPCISPAAFPSPPPTTTTSPKQSSRFKDFFKLRKMYVPMWKDAPSAAISRERNVSSSCRMPVSPRSFWPFSRSNSAGPSKTPRLPPVLPRRSNSAGESKTPSSSILPCKNHTAVPSAKSTSASTMTCYQRTSDRIPPRNVEKCSAVSKALPRSQDFRKSSDSYRAGVRVTPVLNVLVCMGPYGRPGQASKSGLLNFGKLFSRELKSSKVSSATVHGKGRNEV